VDQIDKEQLRSHFARIRALVMQTAQAMPDHADYIARHAKAD
jgi:hypothetical protein